MANVPLIDEGTGNGGGGVHDGRVTGEASRARTSGTPIGVAGDPDPSSSFRGAAGTCRTRPRNLDMFSAKHAEIPGSRARRRARAPGMTVWGGTTASNIFSYFPLTTSPSGLYSPLSCPTERGDRDRHVRGAGCGGRRRCGVTRFMGDVCLRAGRVCASTATGKETADLEMERSLDSVTDDQIEMRPA
jgi:hypothetical protein